jgi:tetratricopeptide (TPR) repeat protein
MIGKLYQKQGNWQKMLTQYEKIITLMESNRLEINRLYYIQSAIACKNLGNKEKAVKYAKNAFYGKKQTPTTDKEKKNDKIGTIYKSVIITI